MFIRQQRSEKGTIVPYTQTDAGKRDIDLHHLLAALVRWFIGTRTSGFLFETSNGAMFSPLNIAHERLRPILRARECRNEDMLWAAVARGYCLATEVCKEGRIGFKLPPALGVLDGQPGQLPAVNHERAVAA
jgi:hypothetical protein